jgi:predicted ArsR family transcriptional regulator
MPPPHAPPAPTLPADRILLALKTRGPLSTAELATVLGVSGEAARQQLVRLEADGLIEGRRERRGVGRPGQRWWLTDRAQQRFPDSHPELTVQLIRNVERTLGEAALDRIIEARQEEQRQAYREAMRGTTTLEDRLKRLASIRAAEGYMASVRKEGDGWLLVENHCPICAAARACQGFCRSELALFREVLGPGVEVERTEHVLVGGRRCAYRVRAPERSGRNTGRTSPRAAK